MASQVNPQQRSELLKAISQLWNRYPHWRLGQLISNIAGWADCNSWDVEDESLLEAATSHLSGEPSAMTDPIDRDAGVSMVEECVDWYKAVELPDGGAELTIRVPKRFRWLWLAKLSELCATGFDIQEYEPRDNDGG